MTDLRSEPAPDSLPRTRPERGETVPERPALASGVELVGELRDSAFNESQWLMQRDGRYIQAAEPVFRIARCANGRRTPERIAQLISDDTEWSISGEQVRRIIASKLIPLGVIQPELGESTAAAPSSPSPLVVNLRMRLLGPRVLDPIAGILRLLFIPPVLALVLIAAALAHGWLYWQHGLSAVLRSVVYTPGSLVAVVAIYVASGVFHELGHASGLRYGGGRARAIGVGIYFIYPAFYTDTTDGYRLGRWARVRTDIGGFYFHLIAALAVMGLFFASGQEWLLLVVVLINLDIARQLIPFVRFDGYWVLTDLIGVPDVLSYMKRSLARSLSTDWRAGPSAELKPFARVVFVLYTVITTPVLVVLLGLLLLRAPLVVSGLSTAAFLSESALLRSMTHGDALPSLLAAMQTLLLALQIVGLGYVIYTMVGGPLKGVWRVSKRSPGRRIAGSVGSGAAVGLLTSFWLSSLGLTFTGMPTGVQTFEVTRRDHVQGPVVYEQSPPVGGAHSAIWQNCGFYSTPIANENGVHSLEHGAVWITYRPDLPAGQVASLRELARRQSYVLVSPYPGLREPLVASAWGRQLRLHSSDDPRLDQFVRAFRLGKQAPESGGVCTGGVGRPDR